MEINNTKKANDAKNGCIILVVLAVFIALTVYWCGGCDDDINANMTYPVDSLLTYFADSTNLTKDGRYIEVDAFDKDFCRVNVTLPKEEVVEIGADFIGKGTCILTVQWLVKRGYQLADYANGKSGLYVSCYVHSPHEKGVTGKDLITIWGNAYYNPNTDNVEWEWAKDSKVFNSLQ
jgi:hypothetical protein